jgi:hypothetical protein
VREKEETEPTVKSSIFVLINNAISSKTIYVNMVLVIFAHLENAIPLGKDVLTIISVMIKVAKAARISTK